MDHDHARLLQEKAPHRVGWQPQPANVRHDEEPALRHKRFDARDPTVMYIDIRYSIRRTNDRRNLVFPFYVIPGGD